LPGDAREALQWFVNNHGLYVGSTRGLFLSDCGDEQQAGLEAAVISLKARGFTPFVASGEMIYRQADYLFKEAREHAQFGRPLASKLELELTGADVVVVDGLEAPENARQLWYLISQILYPRGIAGKATIMTTPLSYQEFARYGDACPDADFCGKPINWEKIATLIDATMVTLELFRLAKEEGMPPMLKAEYYLYTALKERNLDATPQHVLGDYMLDFAIKNRERRLNIECDAVSALGGSEIQRQDAKRNLVLLADGWQVLKFTTAEILANRAACAEATDEVWRTGRKRNPIGRWLTGNSVNPMPDLPVDDDIQLAAITHGGGPAAVTGGAGTGKTTCIVQRAAHLISQGITPETILVLTHNADTLKLLKKAMEQVLDKSLAHRVHTLSWQDLGLKILKENLPAIRRKPPLKIEQSVQKVIARLLAKVKKEIDPAKLELSVDLEEFYISAVISMYKAHLVSPTQAKEEAQTYAEEIIAKVYQLLEEQLQKSNRIDRDDVITMAVQVLLEHPETRLRYQRQFEVVLVDEYQDVTVAQDMLARVLAAPEDNLFMVGDEDETLTECKNACPELFTEMALRMPHARTYVLERNWRSHPSIVDHARQLIGGLQRKRITKEFVSAWGQATASAIIGPACLPDEYEEANWVASEIQILADSGRNYGDIAILFRHNVYIPILEEALKKCGVKYLAAQSEPHLVPDEIEDMLAFLKLVLDPDGPRARECLERVCQLRSREIDSKLSATIAGFAEANNLSYLKAVEIYSEATADQSCGDLEQLVRMIRTFDKEKDRIPPAEMISLIRRTVKLNDYYRSLKMPPGANYEPLKKLTELEDESRNFKTVAEFVKHIVSQRQSGSGTDQHDQGIQMLPLQNCKGTEYPVVFMVGMAEGIFPAESVIDLEEERRICYVGFTRAKELLYVSYPASFAGVGLQPSHFIIDARLLAAAPPMHYVHEAPHEMHEEMAPPVLPNQEYEQQMAAAAQKEYERQIAAQQEQQRQAALAAQQEQQRQAALAAQQEQQRQAALAAQQEQQRQAALAAQQEQQRQAALAAQQEQQRQAALAAQQEQQRQAALAAQQEQQRQAALAAQQEQQRQAALAAQQEQEQQAALAAQQEQQRQAALAAQQEQQRQAALAAQQEQQRQAALAAQQEQEQQAALAAQQEQEQQAALAAQQEQQRQAALAAQQAVLAAQEESRAAAAAQEERDRQIAAAKAALAAQQAALAAQEEERQAAAAAQQEERDLQIAAAKAAQQTAAAALQPFDPETEVEPLETANAGAEADDGYTPVSRRLIPGDQKTGSGIAAQHSGASDGTAAEPPEFSEPVPIKERKATKEPPRKGRRSIAASSEELLPPADDFAALEQEILGAASDDNAKPRSVPPSPPGVPATTESKPSVRWFGSPDSGLQAYTGSKPEPVQELPPLPQSRNAQPAGTNTTDADEPLVPAKPAPQLPNTQIPRRQPPQVPFPQVAEQQPPYPQAPAEPVSYPQAPMPGPQGYPQVPTQQAPYPQAPMPGPQGYPQVPTQPAPYPQVPTQQAPYPHAPMQPQEPYVAHPHDPQGGGYVSHLHPVCPSCGNALEANARFCGGCGYNLPERVPACPTCGAPLESSAKFCGECGTGLSAPVTQGSSSLTNNLTRMQELKDKQHGWMINLLKKLEK
jgi:DNA helicase-2/ATP-dependent DNA helicase PcrA